LSRIYPEISTKSVRFLHPAPPGPGYCAGKRRSLQAGFSVQTYGVKAGTQGRRLPGSAPVNRVNFRPVPMKNREKEMKNWK
jgi:hypothetical protein